MEQTATTRIASNLRAELGRRKLTGRELGRLCNWPPASASRRINGDQAMTMDELHLISQSTNIPLAALLDGLDTLDKADAGRAGLTLIIPVGLLGGILTALAASTGKLTDAATSLPLTPTPNGFTLFCLLVLTIGCWWRLRRHAFAHAGLDQLLAIETWPTDAGEVGPGPDGAFCKGWAGLDPDAQEPRSFVGNPLPHRALKIVAGSREHAAYQAYLCMMSEHGCECVALDFEQWSQVTRP